MVRRTSFAAMGLTFGVTCMVSRWCRHICAHCRYVGPNPTCNKCGKVTLMVCSKWRAPSKRNEKAWKLIESGDIWWDKKAIAKKDTKERIRLEKFKEAIRRKRNGNH